MSKSNIKIVLISPEIPGNTGSIGRTCVALNLELILIHPLSFDISEKAVRRAGLDYWKHVKIKEYKNWNDFLNNESPLIEQMYFFTKTATENNFFNLDIENECYLIFGSETKGLPSEILENQKFIKTSLPMYSEQIRSLNLACAATTAAYEALRKSGF